EQAYRGMTIGLFPGSFNPPHQGHAHVAETALRRLGVDRVWWVVTPQNPWKRAIDTAPIEARMEGARRLAAGPRMIVTDIERGWNVQFSIDLIEKLRVRYPGVQFIWIMGSDNLPSFHQWRRWRDVMETIPIAFVSRPGALARARLALAARAY